jgi:hypothetical protein
MEEAGRKHPPHFAATEPHNTPIIVFLTVCNGSTAILNTGSLSLLNGANFSVDLNGDVAGTGYDQVDVTGTVSLGLIQSNLVIDSVSGLAVGDTLFIVENDGTDSERLPV